MTENGHRDDALEIYGRRLERESARAAMHQGELRSLLREYLAFHGEAAGRSMFEGADIRLLNGYHDYSRTIGHTGLLDFYIKMGLLGWRRHDAVLISPPGLIANRAFLDCWRRHLTIVSEPEWVARFEPLLAATQELSYPALMCNGRALWTQGAVAAVDREWSAQARGPLLSIGEDMQRRGRATLHALGMPEDAWFVSLHVRESGFYREGTSSGTLRNARIGTYLPAIRAVVERGGWVVRLGDPSMTPLPEMPRVIDYALSKVKSDWMDVYLAASCRFFIGTCSGMHILPNVFGTPCVLTNFAPMETRPYYVKDLFIPKLYFAKREARLLSIEEAFRPPLGQCFPHSSYPGNRYAVSGIEAVDNSAEEIAGVVEEMFDRLEVRLRYSTQDEALQARYTALAARFGGHGTNGRVGREFLRRHADLLPQRESTEDYMRR